MAYRIIRASVSFELIIVVTPSDAGPQTKTAEYFRYATWAIGDDAPDMFNPISRHAALGYFSGQADGLGFAVLPERDYDTLDDILTYRTVQLAQLARSRFHGLVVNAYQCSDAEDRTDLDSNNPESVATFRELEREAAQAAIMLIEHCRLHGQRLIEEFLGSMPERTKLRPANYAELPAQEQWKIDRELGILDWDGTG